MSVKTRVIILKGYGVVSGVAKGEALVTKQNFSFWGGLDPKTGVIIDKRHELFGKCVAGKVLVFPTGKGSTTGAIVLLEAARCGTNPKAIINLKTEPILASGALMAKIFYKKTIPIVDQTDKDPTEVINPGDFVIVDGNEGLVKVVVKNRISYFMHKFHIERHHLSYSNILFMCK